MLKINNITIAFFGNCNAYNALDIPIELNVHLDKHMQSLPSKRLVLRRGYVSEAAALGLADCNKVADITAPWRPMLASHVQGYYVLSNDDGSTRLPFELGAVASDSVMNGNRNLAPWLDGLEKLMGCWRWLGHTLLFAQKRLVLHQRQVGDLLAVLVLAERCVDQMSLALGRLAVGADSFDGCIQRGSIDLYALALVGEANVPAVPRLLRID